MFYLLDLANFSYEWSFPYSLYRNELVQQGAHPNEVDRIVEQGFAMWFRSHVSQ